MFDMEKIKRESELTPEQLAQLEQMIRSEFLYDEMMFELHFLRVIEAIQHGWMTVETVL